MSKPLPEITELLPHRGSAILVDKILAETAGGVITTVHIDRSHIFYSIEQSGVPSWVGIEFMAQTIGLHAGLSALRTNEPPRIGYLLGTRRYVPVVPCFPDGANLKISVDQLYWDVSGLGAYDCTIVSEGCLWAHSKIIVFQAGKETVE